jgi:DNA-binding CsgD family transcriptional regulator
MPAIVVLSDDGKILYQNLANDVQELVSAIREGGQLSGYLTSTPAVQINGLVILANQPQPEKRNRPTLTMQQCRVLQCLANGLTPEQTANKMGISEPTVRMHLSALKKKFNTESRDQLMAMAGSYGLCDPFLGEKVEV